MIKNIQQLKKLIESIPDLARIRVVFKDGNKLYKFGLSDVENCPIRDEHKQFQQTVSFMVSEPLND